MALSANSVFEVHTGGNDTNGGGFVTGATGTDYSLVDAKRTATGSNDSTTDAVAAGTGVITSVTAAFTSAIVGNIISLSGGTGTLAQGWYQVTVFTSATSITVDRNVAAGTGITMNIGGALASPGMAGGVGLVDGNIVYIKAGTYTIASATINISTGCFSASVIVHIEGYQTTRGDLGTRPLLQASGISTFTIIVATAGVSTMTNLALDGAGLTSSRGFRVRGNIFNCTAANFTNNAYVLSAVTFCNRCTATGCSTAAAFQDCTGYTNCIAYDNTITGFVLTSGSFALRCIADTNTGASSDGIRSEGSSAAVQNCVAYANGRDGIRAATGTTIGNCIAETNSGFGINLNNTSGNQLTNNATFNNTSGGISIGTGIKNLNLNPVVGTGSFFTNAAGQDFSLNNTASAGASARATGYPGVLPIGGTGFLDIGVLQHADPASSGGARLAGIGGLASSG